MQILPHLAHVGAYFGDGLGKLLGVFLEDDEGITISLFIFTLVSAFCDHQEWLIVACFLDIQEISDGSGPNDFTSIGIFHLIHPLSHGEWMFILTDLV